MNSISELTQLPTITLLSLVFVVLIGVLFHATYDEKVVDFGPTILTTTGIFFTFLGIAIGLKEFDVSNIQASVPALLNGLKTAFWASVAGVGGALTLKARYYAFGLPAKEGWGTGDRCDGRRSRREFEKHTLGTGWRQRGHARVATQTDAARLQRSPGRSKKSTN